MIWMLPSDGSVLDGLAMSSGAHHELEGFVPWMLVDGRFRGRPRKTWCEVLRNDLKLSSLRVEDAENHALWRSKTKTMQRHTHELSGSVTLMDSE